MKLKKIAITNYRQFQNAVINFDDELTILAGANNSGKTSIIELFKRIFKDKNFSKEDISAEYYSKLQYDFISCINKIYNINLFTSIYGRTYDFNSTSGYTGRSKT